MIARYWSIPNVHQYALHLQSYLSSPDFLKQWFVSILITIGAVVVASMIPWVFRAIGYQRASNRRIERFYQVMHAVKLPLLLLISFAIGIGFFEVSDHDYELLEVLWTISLAWVAIRLTTLGVQSVFVSYGARLFIISLLIIHFLGISEDVTQFLEHIAFYWNAEKISLYTILKGILLLILLFWGTFFLSNAIENSLKHSKSLTPSVKILLSKIIKIALLSIAVLLGLNLVGLDLTVFTVFSGAFGLGVGFGLQKIISNFISGIILLSDKSIKPGDVIGIGNTYGWVNALGARYVSVITRDGKEHLIPNEQLITEKVENWSFTNNDVRLRIPIRVSYESDLHQAIQLILDVAYHIPRILNHPEPKCLVRALGEYAIELELRVWIDDPANGMGSVQSEVLLNVLDQFKLHNIQIPYPRYDIVKKS